MTAPPAPVRRSFVLWIAAVVVGLAATVLSAVATPAVAGPGVPGLVVGLLVLALSVWCAVEMRRGRRWARQVLAVVGGITVLSTVLGLLLSAGQGISFGVVSTVAGLVQAALIVAAVLSAHQGSANAWFDSGT